MCQTCSTSIKILANDVGGYAVQNAHQLQELVPEG